ncbi:MAG: hypothetical protein RXR70_03570, partial [Acidilobus sp.]
LVITAGVGNPSGVMGTTFRVFGIPRTKYSRSREGVYSVPSGEGPAMLRPGTVDVKVEPPTYMARGLKANPAWIP